MKVNFFTTIQIACAVIPVSTPAQTPDNHVPVLIQEREWNGNISRKMSLTDSSGNVVCFYELLPKGKTRDLPCVITFHGGESNKEEWIEDDDYTRGYFVMKQLVDAGVAVIAFDLAFHGEHYLAKDSMNYEDLYNNHWEEFYSQSVLTFNTLFRFVLLDTTFDKNRLGIASYSLGGIFAFAIANLHPEFKVLVTMVPPPCKDTDDQYAPYNNQSNLKNVPWLMVAAEKDEYMPFKESKWLYKKLTITNKKFLSYKSGHSLPMDYVPHAVAWFKKYL